eukprot:scaffold2.g7332.t1
MGKGGDAGANGEMRRRHGSIRRTPSMLERLQSLADGLKHRERLQKMKADLLVLKTIWLKRLKDTDDHKERLEGFYGPQAHAYDSFRSKFLWGRRPMLAACAARLEGLEDMVWVDLGGGTGENVGMMADYIDLSKFKHIYVVDLCGPLCEQARKKAAERGWRNVTVVEDDATQFVPPEGAATLVTFSYSLSMIPPFHAAVDRAVSYLDRSDGLLGVADFYASSRYDLPLRQQPWARRFFWRAVFDTDNIDVGPERRNYLDHELSRIWEFNGEGSIPYVPFLRAPYYVWVGRIPKLETLLVENKIAGNDVCLTLTSGGCNSLALCLRGAKAVYSVDCNPAQQYNLIRADGVHMSAYAARTFEGVALNSHIARDNYFYLNCATGRFARDCCPEYLTPEGFGALRGGALDALRLVNGFFLPTLRARTYTKVILMDHADWLSEAQQRELAAALAAHVAPGGRVIWRSAALAPPYAHFIAGAGFDVRCLQRADQGFMDRVNMYSSFWVVVRKAKSA